MHDLIGPRVRTFAGAWSFDTPDAFAALLRSATVSYMSHAPSAACRPYRAGLAVAEFGSVTVQVAEDDAHIAQAMIEHGRHALLYPVRLHGNDVRINAAGIADDGAVVFGPGAELRSITAGPVCWASVAFSAEDGLFETRNLPGPERFSVLAGLGGRAERLSRLATALAALASGDPARLGSGTVAPALAEAWCVAVAAALGPDDAPAPPRAHGRRVRLVVAAEAWLGAALGNAVYTQELAAALGVAPRTLHDAFLAVYGMSVHRYLRLRRLNLARAALRAGGADADLVKMVALRFGFWHLGRFAIAYRALYGESPSETLAAAREPGAA